jgi:hypothetical protein
VVDVFVPAPDELPQAATASETARANRSGESRSRRPGLVFT